MVYPSWNLAGIPRWPTMSQTAFSDRPISSAISRTLMWFKDSITKRYSTIVERPKVGWGAPIYGLAVRWPFVASRLGPEHPTRLRLNPPLRGCGSAVHPIDLSIETVGLCVRFLFVVPVGVEDAPKLCRSAVRKTYPGPCQLFRAPIGSRF